MKKKTESAIEVYKTSDPRDYLLIKDQTYLIYHPIGGTESFLKMCRLLLNDEGADFDSSTVFYSKKGVIALWRAELLYRIREIK